MPRTIFSRHFFMQKSCFKFFSLVELIVVIAIIAILVSLISPTLDSILSKSEIQHCQSNQRQFSVANQLYSEECDGWYTPINMDSPPNRNIWGTRIIQNDLYWSFLGGRKSSRNWYGREWPNKLACPTMPNPEDPDAMWNAYGYNRTGLSPTKYNIPNFFIGLHRNDLTQPSQKIFVLDAVGWVTSVGAGDYNKYYLKTGEYFGPGSWQTVAYRHAYGVNTTYFDGSIFYENMAEFWKPTLQENMPKWNLNQ